VQYHLGRVGKPRTNAVLTYALDCRIRIKGASGVADEIIKYGWPKKVVSINGVDVATATIGTNYRTPGGVLLSIDNKGVLTVTGKAKGLGEGKYSGATWTIVSGRYLILINAPLIDGFVGSNGLCGLFNGFADDDFTAHASTNPTGPVPAKTVAKKKYSVGAWAKTFAVTKTSVIKSFHHEYHQSQANSDGKFELFETTEVPDTVEPTPAELALNDQIQFAGLQQMTQYRAQCASLENVDDAAFENCMYDAAATEEFELAESNIQAAIISAEVQKQQREAAQAADSRDKTLGIVFGVIGGLALLGAIFLGVRLRGVKNDIKHEMTRALVRKDNAMPGVQV